MSFLEGVAPVSNPRRLPLTHWTQSWSIVKVSYLFGRRSSSFTPVGRATSLRGVLFSSSLVAHFLGGVLIFLRDDNLSYFILVRLQRRLILGALSLARRLILLSLPFTGWSLESLHLIMRWTGYINLGRCPTRTPQVPIHLEGCRLSRYFQPLKSMDVANEARQQRKCEG